MFSVGSLFAFGGAAAILFAAPASAGWACNEEADPPVCEENALDPTSFADCRDTCLGPWSCIAAEKLCKKNPTSSNNKNYSKCAVACNDDGTKTYACNTESDPPKCEPSLFTMTSYSQCNEACEPDAKGYKCDTTGAAGPTCVPTTDNTNDYSSCVETCNVGSKYLCTNGQCLPSTDGSATDYTTCMGDCILDAGFSCDSPSKTCKLNPLSKTGKDDCEKSCTGTSAKYSCDQKKGQCNANAFSGTQTLQECQDSCLAETYSCDSISATCRLDPFNTDTLAMCEAKCDLYICDTGTGMCVQSNIGGEPKDDCDDHCVQELYSCNQETGMCESDPFGGDSKNDCEASCSQTYFCSDENGCQPDPSGAGDYPNLSDCKQDCKAAPSAPSSNSTDDDSSWSAGDVLVLIFFISLVLYLAVGMGVGYNNGKRGAEMIPNIDFWSSLPGLIADGSKFVFSCGRSVAGSGGGGQYQEI